MLGMFHPIGFVIEAINYYFLTNFRLNPPTSEQGSDSRPKEEASAGAEAGLPQPGWVSLPRGGFIKKPGLCAFEIYAYRPEP